MASPWLGHLEVEVAQAEAGPKLQRPQGQAQPPAVAWAQETGAEPGPASPGALRATEV